MDTDPLVSLIVPVYNVLPYLRQALDSDDWMEKRAVEVLPRETDDTDADIVCCQRITEQLGASAAPQGA